MIIISISIKIRRRIIIFLIGGWAEGDISDTQKTSVFPMAMAHSRMVLQHLSVTWPYGHEWDGRDPVKNVC